MTIVFWIVVLLIVYAYVGYAAAVLLLSLFVHRPVRSDDAYEPDVTLLITAYNEERDIARKLEDCLRLDYPASKFEIIVASDGSTDDTDRIVNSFAARHDNVKLIRVEGRVGKTETQNQAVAQARGEVIVFSDATTEYRGDAIRKLVRNYADPDVGAVSGKYSYRTLEKSAMGRSTIVFWDYENLIKSRQTRIKTITGCCGCIYSVRKKAYVPLPGSVISDLVEPLKVIERGYRIVFETEAIAYETTTEKVKDEFRMRVRVITRGMNGILYVRRLLNPFKYPFVAFQLVSHKVLRWLVPILLVILFGATLALVGRHWFYGLALGGQAAVYGLAGLGVVAERLGYKLRVLALPLYFCVVNLAALVGMFNIIRGERKMVWETVRD
jgi:cellulose synthase/poly-beta-1,6-N-acetylglucosamine synthase-like glycosyltransferase